MTLSQIESKACEKATVIRDLMSELDKETHRSYQINGYDYYYNSTMGMVIGKYRITNDFVYITNRAFPIKDLSISCLLEALDDLIKELERQKESRQTCNGKVVTIDGKKYKLEEV